MCGRFTLTVEQEELARAFAEYAISFPHRPRFNIAPTQDVAVILNDGTRRITLARWGLMPSRTKDAAAGRPLINARAETVAAKPTFRTALRQRRCLVLADGFYEWKDLPGEKLKQPFYIRLKTGRPFTFAGLWNTFSQPDGQTAVRCALITTGPNELMAKIHDRMPVILPVESRSAWLKTDELTDAESVPLLGSYPADQMQARIVSRSVNNPRYDDRSCIEPVELPGDLFGNTPAPD